LKRVKSLLSGIIRGISAPASLKLHKFGDDRHAVGNLPGHLRPDLIEALPTPPVEDHGSTELSNDCGVNFSCPW
jgi:hypothetical protein